MAFFSDVQYNTAFIFAGVFFITYVYFKRKNSTAEGVMAPRLAALPLIGSLPFMPPFQQMHVWFLNQLSTLGAVVGLYSRDRYSIVLLTRESVNEALVEHSATFAGRPALFVNMLLNPRRLGIVERPIDETFKKDHQLVLSIMKQFGFGKQNIMELRINQEVDELIAELNCTDARSAVGIYPLRPITASTVNIISSILLGYRFQRNDPQLDILMSNIGDFFRQAVHLIPVNLFPILRFIPAMRRQIGEFVRLHDKLMGFIAGRVDDIVTSMTSSTNNDELPNASFVRSFVEMNGGPTGFNREQLLFIVRDLISAGFETTASAINWAVVLLADNPDVQRKVQMEIDSISGSDEESRPSLADRLRLPYTEATILEILRFKTIIPMSVPRETLHDATVEGYKIPVGTMVIPNLYGLHMNKSVWTDPDIFKPERFLDKTGTVVMREKVIPFSIGRRSCLGESLARHEIFLFVTALMRCYSILPPEGQARVVYHETIGITLTPSPYKVRFVPRR